MAFDTPDYSDKDNRAGFVLDIVLASENARDSLLSTWEEAWNNYLVIPSGNSSIGGKTDNPLGRSQGLAFPSGKLGKAILKDPESYQVVESLLAELMLNLFPDDPFVRSRPQGYEDSDVASTCNRIIERSLRKPKHRLVFYRWAKDGLIYGTGIVFGEWKYEEDYELIRAIAEIDGISVSTYTRLLQVVQDDVCFENVDLLDFYPMPGADCMEDMPGAVRRYEVFADDLKKAANSEQKGWDSEAVDRAIEFGGHAVGSASSSEDIKPEQADEPDDETPPQFKPLVAYEYWGSVPWAEDGQSSRKRLTVVNGVLCREEEWPLRRGRLPFFDFTVNPINGRFYGLSPLEVIRHDQDLADVIKMMVADAVVKAVNPPHAYNVGMGINVNKLREFSGDVPIPVEGDPRIGITQLPYAPPVGPANDIMMLTKQAMREAAGAQGGVQGQGLGSKRFSASEAQTTFRQQFARPNMMAQLVEQVHLPPIGEFIIDSNAMWLDSTKDLVMRIGEDPPPVDLAQLQGKFDVFFIGSRQEHDKVSRVSARERFIAVVGQVPEIRAHVPWREFIRGYLADLDLVDLRNKVGTEETIRDNALLMLVLQQGIGPASNGNGVSAAVAGGSPEQQVGGLLQ